jgi:hypothetical protein
MCSATESFSVRDSAIDDQNLRVWANFAQLMSLKEDRKALWSLCVADTPHFSATEIKTVPFLVQFIRRPEGT